MKKVYYPVIGCSPAKTVFKKKEDAMSLVLDHLKEKLEEAAKHEDECIQLSPLDMEFWIDILEVK